MRRIWATVLLFLISVSLMTPLLLAGPEAGIAPCCRRDGKHHCAKMAKTEAIEGLVRVTATMACPLFNGGKSTPAVAQAVAAPPAYMLFFVPAVLIAKERQAAAQLRISEFRSSLKRGPPCLLT